MNIRQQLLKNHSRQNADFVEAYVVDTPGAIIQLMACFFSDEVKVAQRSAQVVGNLGRHHPAMLKPWWAEMVASGNRPVHQAIRRNVARYFSELELAIPKKLESSIVDSFTDWSCDSSSPVAVSVFAMQFVADRCNGYPIHAKRVRTAIESQLASASPGFCNRGRKIIKQLDAAR